MLTIIIKEIKFFFRTPSNVFFTILFPALLVFVLGTFLENFDNSDAKVGEIRIHYASTNTDTASDIAMSAFLDSLVQSNTIVYSKSDDLALSLNLVDTNELDGVIELKDGNIILHAGENSVKNRTLKLLMNSYQRMSAVYLAAAKINPSALLNVDTSSEISYVSAKDLGVNRTMLDYYAVAMIVMSLFMCNLVSGANANFDENINKTNLRLHISPVSKIKIYMGKIIGNMLSAIIQIITIMVTSVCFFDSHYCKDLMGNIVLCIMFLCCTLALLSLGMLISQIVKFTPTAIIMPFAWAMLFYSGTYSKEIYVEGFSNRMPPYLIQQAAFDLTIFGKYESVLYTIAVSLVLFIVFTITGTAMYYKKGGVQK